MAEMLEMLPRQSLPGNSGCLFALADCNMQACSWSGWDGTSWASLRRRENKLGMHSKTTSQLHLNLMR
jgi:hypothetical protein